MRVDGEKGAGIGAFYVPKAYHLRILLATEDLDGGWWSTYSSCAKDIACQHFE
jgi:hypothetical protein